MTSFPKFAYFWFQEIRIFTGGHLEILDPNSGSSYWKGFARVTDYWLLTVDFLGKMAKKCTSLMKMKKNSIFFFTLKCNSMAFVVWIYRIIYFQTKKNFCQTEHSLNIIPLTRSSLFSSRVFRVVTLRFLTITSSSESELEGSDSVDFASDSVSSFTNFSSSSASSANILLISARSCRNKKKVVKWQNLELHFAFWREKISRDFVISLQLLWRNPQTFS